MFCCAFPYFSRAFPVLFPCICVHWWLGGGCVGGLLGGQKTQDAGVVEPPETACIAVAGPVSQNRVVMTNRNWIIDGGEVSLWRLLVMRLFSFILTHHTHSVDRFGIHVHICGTFRRCRAYVHCFMSHV